MTTPTADKIKRLLLDMNIYPAKVDAVMPEIEQAILSDRQALEERVKELENTVTELYQKNSTAREIELEDKITTLTADRDKLKEKLKKVKDLVLDDVPHQYQNRLLEILQ